MTNGSGFLNGFGLLSPEQEFVYRLLGEIGVVSFIANPLQVAPFETTTLSWSVTLPPALLHTPVSLTVAGQTSRATAGSVTNAPFSTTEYYLTAEALSVNRRIAAVRVQVNGADCRAPSFPSVDITSPIQNDITQLFPEGGEFALKGVAVDAISDNVISINISTAASIAVQIGIGMQGAPPHATVSAQLISVNVNVDVSTTDKILSLGAASKCGDTVESIIEFFISAITKISVAPGIAAGINGLIQTYANAQQGLDPAHRTYALTSATLTAQSFTFTVCPLPDSSTQQAGSPAEAPN